MKILFMAIAVILLSAFFAALWTKLQSMRASVGILAQAAAPGLTPLQKFRLRLLGLKTPICSTLGTFFLFVSTERASLQAFNWDAFISHDKAVLHSDSSFGPLASGRISPGSSRSRRCRR